MAETWRNGQALDWAKAGFQQGDMRKLEGNFSCNGDPPSTCKPQFLPFLDFKYCYTD